MSPITDILSKETLAKTDIVQLLQAEGRDKEILFTHASEVKNQHVGRKVYLRGLVEYSNICLKDCYYCGIRLSNKKNFRYKLTLKDVEEACYFAIKHNFASMVIQSGELQSKYFAKDIKDVVKLIKQKSGGEMRVTLSCGEQEPEVYEMWRDAGAERYLLRIETSNSDLYRKIHPDNKLHSFEDRLNHLKKIKEAGFQTGTGVMIGLPFQTIEDLADDILFMREMDIDMCGMGPYIEHKCTPLYRYSDQLLPLHERYQLSLKMIAVLRIVMKKINIASTTALQAIDAKGKRAAIEVGANVMMPNLTPAHYKTSYHLYQNKPGSREEAFDELKFSVNEILKANNMVAFSEYGDSLHYLNK